MVIDQHALHERILYEELKRRVEREGVESQRLLVPEPVDLPGARDGALILEQREVLKSLGLEIEPFGGDTILIHGTPAMLTGVAPERLLRDLADHFATKPLPPTADAILADLLNMIACKAAVKAGQRLTADEMQALLDAVTWSPTHTIAPMGVPRLWCSRSRSWSGSSGESERFRHELGSEAWDGAESDPVSSRPLPSIPARAVQFGSSPTQYRTAVSWVGSGSPTMICVTLGRGRHASLAEEWNEAAAAGAELVELRLDCLRREPDLKRILANRPTPLVFTIRRGVDGGIWRGSEDRRRQLLARPIAAWGSTTSTSRWISRSRFAGSARRSGSSRYHNLKKTPTELIRISREQCDEMDADVVNIAAKR